MILAGDIGGTHTRLAFFEKGKKLVETKFLSQKYSRLEDIVREFLSSHKQKISRACFGVAGPVRNGKCKTTNLPWTVDALELSENLQIQNVYLLNDLEANAYSIKGLKKEELFVLQKGEKGVGNQALIAAGTGLGEAGLFWDGREHHPFACEGGHCDFAARTEEEFSLFLYLSKKFDHVSYERVVSGPGLYSIFQFLIETKRAPFSSEVKDAMKTQDPAKVVSDFGMKNRDVACSLALDWFSSLYGAEAGNLALKFLPLGGLYIGGGIAPHILQRLQEGAFLSSFLGKGRFRKILETVPVFVILNDDTALLGAAAYAEGK